MPPVPPPIGPWLSHFSLPAGVTAGKGRCEGSIFLGIFRGPCQQRKDSCDSSDSTDCVVGVQQYCSLRFFLCITVIHCTRKYNLAMIHLSATRQRLGSVTGPLRCHSAPRVVFFSGAFNCYRRKFRTHRPLGPQSSSTTSTSSSPTPRPPPPGDSGSDRLPRRGFRASKEWVGMDEVIGEGNASEGMGWREGAFHPRYSPCSRLRIPRGFRGMETLTF